ncbi:OmpA family protein [Rickettsiales bacterium LUAb2]
MKFLKISTILLMAALFACSKPKTQEPTPVANAPVAQEKSADNNIDFAANATVYFDFDVANPKSEEQSKIENQAKWLLSHNFKQVTIEGNTDIYGTREYNLALGERRANSIKEILVRAGVSASKIKVVSYGKEHLADQDVQWKNRRTLTKVTN